MDREAGLEPDNNTILTLVCIEKAFVKSFYYKYFTEIKTGFVLHYFIRNSGR